MCAGSIYFEYFQARKYVWGFRKVKFGFYVKYFLIAKRGFDFSVCVGFRVAVIFELFLGEREKGKFR